MGRWIYLVFLLLCLASVTSLSGCAVDVTEWRLKAQSSQSNYTYVCRRTPDIPEGVQYWAVNTDTGETVTDREPERLLEFAKVADRIYEYHPQHRHSRWRPAAFAQRRSHLAAISSVEFEFNT